MWSQKGNMRDLGGIVSVQYCKGSAYINLHGYESVQNLVHTHIHTCEREREERIEINRDERQEKMLHDL